jgi:murein DD-endopeptidase MepM/ murein hydrolase activator NlpD
LGKPKHHDGVDYGTAKGNEVYAVAGGVVETSDFTDINGNYVAIKHADGITSYYLHLNEKGIAKGSAVEAGQEIGKVGSTGRSTGPHLHLGIMKNGKWEDPEKILGIH